MLYPQLNRSLTEEVFPPDMPPGSVWSLPEKILQFGSGRFLRAFVGNFVDHANRKGLFNGRIVVVQSTGDSRTHLFNDQDGLYTLCLRGVYQGKAVEEYLLLSAVSRALAANESWESVLECARNPDLELIISNTTEVGIVLDPEDQRTLTPPRSFPGKLTACLYERYAAFEGAADKGLILIPCELINNNGSKLKEIVLELSQRWELPNAFCGWVESANSFCNSLVDRIVTGTPHKKALKQIQKKLGYEDNLVTMAEVYSLWAIEGDASLRKRLAFADVNPSIVITNDISPYRERKIRILNGTHTISAPLSFLKGNNTILESMHHSSVSSFIENVMHADIGPSLDVKPDSVKAFTEETLDRFKNPYLKHQLLDITFQSTKKMRLRVIPSILRHYEKKGVLPSHLCFGFAHYLWFMRGVEKKDGEVFGRRGKERYRINDDAAEYFATQWSEVSPDDPEQILQLVERICDNSDLWGVQLTAIEGFCEKVARNLERLIRSIV